MKANAMAQEVLNRYSRTFEGAPIVRRSPGQGNIIGEQNDYNDGLVLRAAIDKAAYVAVGRRDDRRIQLYSEHFNETFECSLDALQPSD